MQLRCMCSCLGAREKESPSHMHFGHCWALFGLWCFVALFGSVCSGRKKVVCGGAPLTVDRKVVAGACHRDIK